MSLDNYIDVPARMAEFGNKHPQGRVYTESWGVENTNWDTYVWCRAVAERYPGDVLPGVGLAWERTPGETPYTYGSELQNAETSAWGRALRNLGGQGPVASREEVELRQAPIRPEQVEVLLKLCVEAGEDRSRLALVAVGVAAPKAKKVGEILTGLTPFEGNALAKQLA